VPVAISQSVKSPSNSSTQIGGTGSRGKPRAIRTASSKASGVNADASSNVCASGGMRPGFTPQVYRTFMTRYRFA